MDIFDNLLAAVRFEQARYVQITACRPWGIAFPAREVARLVLVSGASARLTGAAHSSDLTGTSCFLVRAGVEFQLQDEPGRPLVDCADIEKGADLTATIGGDGPCSTIASSRFAVDPAMANALLAPLPPITPIALDGAAGRLLTATFALVAGEAHSADLGAGYIAGELTKVLFVQALRACFGTTEHSTGWLAALRDPRLGGVLRAMHDDLARPWTINELARTAGMSRTAFVVLFRKRTGQTPLTYLTFWRMYEARRLLAETDRSVAQIAGDVGYVTGQSFTRAFTRAEGVAPGQWRSEAGAGLVPA